LIPVSKLLKVGRQYCFKNCLNCSIVPAFLQQKKLKNVVKKEIKKKKLKRLQTGIKNSKNLSLKIVG
jgi:hypothetical protein